MADHNEISRQINEFEKLTRELTKGYLPKRGDARIIELLDSLESHCDSLVKNERKSLILLQRLQRAVGFMIVEAPNWLYSHGMLEKSVKMSPDPTQLGAAIGIGLFHMMLGDKAEYRKLVALGLEAVRLGGMMSSALRIMDNGYGLSKDQSVAFVPWRATAAQKRMGIIATEMLTGLLHNTLECSYTVEPSTLDRNLREVVGSLMYFGGELGCRAALDALPAVLEHTLERNTEGQAVSAELRITNILVEAFEFSRNSNVLYALREHSYPDFLKLFEEFSINYQIGNSIKSDMIDFDIAVLPVESSEAKKAVVEAVNEVFCGNHEVGHQRAVRLLKMLRHFGLRGEELRLAASNSHVSNTLQWVLDICLSGGDAKDFSKVRPRDVVTKTVEFGENAGVLYSEFMKAHVKCLESTIEFFKDDGACVTRNALVLGEALKDPRVKPVLSDPDAMDNIGACVMYHYGADLRSAFEITRDSFSEIEIAGIAGFIKRHMDKEDSKPWNLGLEDELKEALSRCAEHPVTKKSVGMLPPESVEHFKTIFKEWFTPRYCASIEWRDYRFKGARLEDDLGM